MSSPAIKLCTDLAGFGATARHRAWFRVQVLCWVYLAVAAAHSARRWAAHWGAGRGHAVIMVGSCKTFGFMLMDLLAIVTLFQARRAYHRFYTGGQLPKMTQARLRGRAWALVALGLGLATVEGVHWGLRLYELRHRRHALGSYYLFTAIASACVVLTKPGFVCAFLPAVAGRDEARSVVEELLAEVRGGKADWDRLLIEYGKAEGRVAELSAEFSPALGCLLLTVGLEALLHSVSIWIWVERLSFAPSAAVNVHYALAVLYTLVFLSLYFAFTGLGASHGQLVGAVAQQLRSSAPGDVGKLVQAFHYLRARPLRWSLQLGPGRLDIDELKGRYMSAGFAGNLAAKLVPRLRGHLGKPAARAALALWWRLPPGARPRPAGAPWASLPARALEGRARGGGAHVPWSGAAAVLSCHFAISLGRRRSREPAPRLRG